MDQFISSLNKLIIVFKLLYKNMVIMIGKNGKRGIDTKIKNQAMVVHKIFFLTKSSFLQCSNNFLFISIRFFENLWLGRVVSESQSNK